MPFHQLIKFFDHPAGKRTHDHGCHQHRLSIHAADAGDASDDGDRTDDHAAFLGDHLAAGRGNQDRKQISEHIGLYGSQLRIGQPAVGDKQGGDESPGNERPDIGHDHCG